MTDPANPPRFLTLAQVAEELNVKQSVVQGLIRAGELRGFQVGGRGLWRIGRQDVEDYIAGAYQRAAERIAAGELTDDAEADTSEEE
ncbi:UNVERIFIED_ORG: excisionase family DNA binding protein [Arthrobacter globiformis]|nr:excisionase family DNA binding protein [Arthrobacter globiformis]